MHGYFWNKVKLAKELSNYVGGQFQIESIERCSDSMIHKILRGQVLDLRLDLSSKKREVFVRFAWICEKSFPIKGNEDEIEFYKLSNSRRWNALQVNSEMKVVYTTYYFQRDEDRVKLWTDLKETAHFYKQGDHTNLIMIDDKFVEYRVANYKKLLLSLCYTIVINSKKIKK